MHKQWDANALHCKIIFWAKLKHIKIVFRRSKNDWKYVLGEKQLFGRLIQIYKIDDIFVMSKKKTLLTIILCLKLLLTSIMFFIRCPFCSQNKSSWKNIFSELTLFLAPLVTENALESGFFFEFNFRISPPPQIKAFPLTLFFIRTSKIGH